MGYGAGGFEETGRRDPEPPTQLVTKLILETPNLDLEGSVNEGENDSLSIREEPGEQNQSGEDGR